MTAPVPTYAVIPTEGRPCLYDCIDALRDQVDRIVLVVNSGYNGTEIRDAIVMRDRTPGPNVSRWWNIGLNAIAVRRIEAPETNRWNVLVVNDDTIMAPGSVAVLTAGLRKYPTAQMAYPGDRERLLIEPGPDRVTGWCFALAGEGGLRFDERMRWWYSDNMGDWQARLTGGTAVVPGVGHTHLHPNGYTVARPDLTEQAGRDRDVFMSVWGRLPH